MDPHEPSPEFLEHLARETRFALRRPMSDGGGGERLRRALRAALLALTSLGAGAGLVLAREHAQDARRVELELAQNRVRLELAQRREAALEERAATVRVRADAGRATAGEAREAELLVADATRLRRHAELERESLERGGPALRWISAGAGAPQPSFDLRAALVGGRDLVREHLEVEREASALARAAQAEALALARLRYESGLVPVGELERVETEAAQLELTARALDARLALRAELLTGRLGDEAALRAELRIDVEQRRELALLRVESLRRQLARAEQLAEAGLAPAPDAQRLALDEAEAELALAGLELEMLE